MNMMTPTTSPFEGKGGVIVDPARAYEVLDAIVPSYLERKALFRWKHRSDGPQNAFRPEKLPIGGIRHARWLFFSAMTDRREQSQEVYKGHARIWNKHADLLYDNPIPAGLPAERIESIMRDNGGFGMARTSSKIWLKNSRILFTHFAGDPRKLFEGRSVGDLVALKKELEFPGFGPKILSLLAMFLAEAKMIEMPSDAFPIDVHVQRISLSTGIVKIKKDTVNEHMELVLRPLLTSICHERGWDMVEVAHALWLLGNNLCTRCSRTSEASFFCPAYALCKGPFESRRYFKEGKWDPTRQTPPGDRRTCSVPVFTDGLFQLDV